MENPIVLILPGWQGSGPSHWQSLWTRQYADQLVEQHDWMRPLRGDWLARLDDVMSDLSGPVFLVAHSLGCIQVAAWAQISAQCHKVKAALLVAPGDVEASPVQDVFSYCTLARAEQFALAWGSEFLNLGECGHVNAESNLGDWPEGRALLNELMKEKRHGD